MDIYTSNPIIEFESQQIETELEAHMLYKILLLAKEAGYTEVRDNWGVSAWNQYTIDEAIKKFKPNL